MLKFKDPKIFLFLIPFVGLVSFLANVNKSTAIEFNADGTVFMVNWEGKNHGAPLILIQQNDLAGTKKKFESTKIILKENDIKVGDKFVKIAGESTCTINEVVIKCVG